jgi:hypothetical protein
VNFQSPLRRHSSNPRAIQPLEDHHEQSSRDSDGHYRDESNPDGDGDPSGNRARTHIFSRKPLKMDAAPSLGRFCSVLDLGEQLRLNP